MRRLSPLHIMTSHSHLYSKLDEFGKDFNLPIKKRVADKCSRLSNPTISTSSTNDASTSNDRHATAAAPTGSDGHATAAAPTSSDGHATAAAPTSSDGHATAAAHTGSNGHATAAGPTRGNQVIIQPDKGRKLTFDNFDIRQEVHHMTEQNKTKDKHYVSVMSTENRVSSAGLSREVPHGDILTMENGKCVPNHTEHQKQRKNYVTLVSRIINAEYISQHVSHMGDFVKNLQITDGG